MAAAFVNSGAETAFVNVGDVNIRTLYTQFMLETIIAYMAGTEDGIFHTADEALALAREQLDDKIVKKEEPWDIIVDCNDTIIDCDGVADFEERAQGGTHVEIRGVGIYTLCSCIRGTVAFEDAVTEEKQNEILKTLTVHLENEDGELLQSEKLDEAEFYFNQLEPGTYYVSLYKNEKLAVPGSKVTVKEHRYSEVTLAYGELVRLEGYVYDEEGNSLSGVSVEVSGNNVEYNTDTTTDADGHYSVEVYGENDYTFSYTLDGYKSVTNVFSVTSEMDANAQNGIATTLQDVTLQKIVDIPDDAFTFNNHKYYVFQNCSTWDEARDYCESLGGHLAVISSAEENQALFSYITSVGYDSAYFGYTDEVAEGIWCWVDEESSSYTNWHEGEPNAENSQEDYAMYYWKYEEGQWNDGDFGGMTVNGGDNFICEWDFQVVK